MTDFVTVEARALRQAMKIILAVVERRNIVPILSCARLKYDDAGFRITGTDLDTEITASVDLIDGKHGLDICIDARKLAEIAAAAGVMPMKIERTGNGVTITLDSGAAIYTIPAFPSEDFPTVPGERGDLIEQFGNGSLAALMSKVKWCISTEETRYYLNGIAWQSNKNGRYFVATDGHRLAACRYDGETGDQPDRIIPRKLVGIITQHLKGANVKLHAVPATNMPRLDILAPGITIRSKLIDGTFPDWTRVVPSDHKHVFKFRCDEITTAMTQATAIGNERTKAVKFAPGEDKLVIEHSSAEFGKARVMTSAVWPEGADEFGFNSHYFRMVAANCESEMELRMTDRAAPFSFHDSDETMTRVLMPMRV